MENESTGNSHTGTNLKIAAAEIINVFGKCVWMKTGWDFCLSFFRNKSEEHVTHRHYCHHHSHHHHAQRDLPPLLHGRFTLPRTLLWLAGSFWSPEQPISVSHQDHGKSTLELPPGALQQVAELFEDDFIEKEMIKMINLQSLSWYVIVKKKSLFLIMF